MSVELKTRRQARIGDFRGVDFSSSPLLVKSNRAVESKNFIFENGVNRKRHGWIERYRLSNSNINGIFECNINGIKCLIAYTNKKFYKIYKDENNNDIIEDITNTSTSELCKVNSENLVDNRCQMFASNGRFYFIGCGDYLTYGKYKHSENDDEIEQYEFRRVENDEYTYIPTTTVDIGACDSVDDIKEIVESPNLLTNKRKNTIISSIRYTSTTSGEKEPTETVFYLDSTIDSDLNNKEMPCTEVKIEYTINGEVRTIRNKVELQNEGTNPEILYNENNEKCGTFNYGSAILKINFGKLIDVYVNSDGEIDKFKLTVTYSHNNNSNPISKSKFGILFGVDGNSDRLFVSGNENYPNYDYFSRIDDFTYFPDNNVNKIGSSNSKIMGYSRLDDGVLAIHKEEVNGEPSIYYRTGKAEYKLNEDSSSLEEYNAYFPVKAGAIGESMISNYANANLSGDKIFLSRNGLYGITLSNNIVSGERFSKNRSEYIDAKLCKNKHLEEAVGIVYNNKYYLAINNECYVADARFKTQNLSDTNSFNYEWYYWDNMPVRVWGIIDNELCFGTKDGRICFFDEEYSDRIFEKTQTNELLLDYYKNNVSYNNNLGIKNKDIIIFKTDVFNLKIDSTNILKVDNNKIFVDVEVISNLFNEELIYVDNVNDSGLSVDTKYFIKDVDSGNCSFTLVDEAGNQVNINNVGFRIFENLKDVELEAYNVESDSFSFKYLKGDNRKINIQKYNNKNIYNNPMATFMVKNNVIASWYSPILDFGTNQSSKTLLSITISTEPIVNGQVQFGYLAKNTESKIDAQGINLFDFENLDFNNFTFDSSFANSYTVDIKDYFNFIQFFFKSDNDNDCVIHSISVIYKINSNNKGVN